MFSPRSTSSVPVPPPAPVRRRRERGISIIFVAIVAIFLIGLVGIALDSAFVLSTAQQLQQAADAAALAAARLVQSEADPTDPSNPYTVTRQAAIDVALANVAAKTAVALDPNVSNDPNGDIVIGVWDKAGGVFIPDLIAPNAVKVRAIRTPDKPDGPLNLIFGPAFGAPTSDVGVSATAAVGASGGALMVILDPTMAGALSLNGTVHMSVNGDIHVNSSAACAADLEGEPEKLQVFTNKVCVNGTACYNSNAIKGTVVDEEPDCVVPDPLASVLPTPADWNAERAALLAITPLDGSGNPLTIIDKSGTFSPGYYSRGMSLSSGMKVTLQPGTYMFGPPNGITLKGSSFVTAGNATPGQCADSFAGVTILIDQGAKVDVSGNGAGLAVTAPTSGPLANIAMFHHRANTGSAESKITGGGAFVIRGYLYVPGGEAVIGGGPGKAIGGLIVDRLSNAGTTSFSITGCGIPADPDALIGTYLVE
jgi:hypothetical protein